MTSLSPSDLGEEACQGNDGDFMYSEDQFLSSQSDTLTNLSKEVLAGSECTSMSQDAFEAIKTVKPMEKLEPFMVTEEESGLLCAPGSDVNSPRDIVSPSAGSSPFSAMESDGEGIETGMDEASLSGIGDTSFHGANGFFNSTYTTTPCASSSACDDDYESTGSRKKRRKRREMHHPAYHSNVNGLTALQFARAENQGPWQQPDSATSPFSPPTCTQKMNFNFAENSSRRSSSGMTSTQITKTEFSDENAKRPRTGDALDNEEMLNTSGNSIPVKVEMPATIDTPVSSVKSGVRRHHAHHRISGSADEEQILHKQYPRKAGSFELRILAQPEPQHRARYLTEGSRGPVKDGTQQGFPKVELLGYNGPATLQVFVATDSGKVKPHGFYQACKVTGRNTSTCEEIEIEGTKVIEIPFKQDAMVLSIDCVGILKLRNTDVEVRTGIRNQKRNQSVRLLFRVSVPSASSTGIVTLQIASTRISCTQPLGQPEITKKSIDRCSVEGGIEMFIIGKNFHRGTKVIYQDPEEPNDTQWCEEGEVDKDTFHQSHMVVRVPPYHDLDIQKPVNVQLLVEFQDKRCEPHSFTYTPRQKDPEPPKDDTKKVTQQPQGNVGPPNNIESALGGILDGPIDKKFLITLFSKLLAGGITAQPDSPGSSMAHTPEPTNSEAQTQPPLLNAFANPAFMESAAPLLQGILHPPLQTQTVVEVVPEADVKLANPVTNFSNPFANFQFALQPSKMSFTQALSNAEPTLLSNAAPVSTPVAQVFNPIQVPVSAVPTPASQVIFNPAPIPAVAPQVSQINFNPAPATGVATNPMSQISFNTSLCAGISPSASQISFNPQPSIGIANPPVLVATHPIPTAAVSVPISQVNLNPMIATGLSNTVSPSVGSVALNPAGSHVQVKSETSIPEMMLNVTNTQTNPTMVSSSNLQTTFPGIQQVPQIQPSFAPPTQDPTPPPTIISPVSQPLLYNSFYAANPPQGSTAPAFSNVPVSFVNVSAAQGGLAAQSLPQVVTFTAASVVSTPSQQAQTYQANNFQVSLPQQLQQQVFTSAASNQIFVKQPQVVGNAPAASHNLGVLNQSPVVSFTSAQPVALPAVLNQASAQFQSPFVEKKSDDYSSNQVGQNPMIQTIQSPKEVVSHQFAVTPQQTTQVNNNFGIPNQQSFSVTVVDQPMQQDHTIIGQGQPQLHQQPASFGTTNQQQQQFAAEIKDQVMPQQSNIVVSQNQFTLVGQAQQQQQQTVFNAQPQMQFSVSGQQQQMELFPMATQNNQTATQQQPTAQIVHIQQVAQNPPIASQPQRPQDNQMHVDPFVEPQPVVNLQAQPVGLPQSNVFSVQQTGMQQNAPVQQPMEDVLPTPVLQTIDHQMKDAGQPQIPQQQQQQQQSFHIQTQPVLISVASEVTSPPLRQQGTDPTQAAVMMQPASVYQNIQQPANVTIVSTGTSLPEQNFASPQQVCSPVATLQTSGIITPAMPVQQIFQSQLPTAQHIPVESPNASQMQAQHYQSPEAVTKSPPPVVVPNVSQQQFQAMPPPQQQALPNTVQMQTQNNYIYQDGRGAQIQQQESANGGEANAALQQQQHQRRNPTANIIVNNQLEPRSPDVFALTKLLQSIDGSELAAITGEDVQRHCQ